MNRWLFQSNPERWRLWDYLNDHPEEDFQKWTWSAVRYLDEISTGDSVAFWLVGRPKVRGVYAVGRVTRPPEESTGWSEYAVNLEDRRRSGWMVPMAFESAFFSDPILASDLKSDARFSGASILKMPRAGNPYKLSEEEWTAIIERVPA